MSNVVCFISFYMKNASEWMTDCSRSRNIIEIFQFYVEYHTKFRRSNVGVLLFVWIEILADYLLYYIVWSGCFYANLVFYEECKQHWLVSSVIYRMGWFIKTPLTLLLFFLLLSYCKNIFPYFRHSLFLHILFSEPLLHTQDACTHV